MPHVGTEPVCLPSAVITQHEYDELELEALRRRLADVTAPGRQVPPSPAGQEYRRQLQADIQALEERLASEKG